MLAPKKSSEVGWEPESGAGRVQAGPAWRHVMGAGAFTSLCGHGGSGFRLAAEKQSWSYCLPQGLCVS